MWMHTHIYSWKLVPGFVLLAKVCPLTVTFVKAKVEDEGGGVTYVPSKPATVELKSLLGSF